MLGLDCYGPFDQAYYDDMNALSAGKVMAISETSNPQTVDVYRTQLKWTYYMKWATDRPIPGQPVRVRPASQRGPDLHATAGDARIFSLPDPAYRAAIALVRVAAGLPPLTSPPLGGL